MFKLKHFISKFYYNYISQEGRYFKWDVLNKSQFNSRLKIEEFQSKKLEDILKYAVHNVPAYSHMKYDNSKSPQQNLLEFPITDKGYYRSKEKSALSLEKDELNYYKSSTSGSTGESFFFLLDMERHAWAMAAKYRTDAFCNIFPNDSRASLWGASFDNKNKKSFKKRVNSYLTPFTFMSSYNMSEEQLFNYVELIKKRKPKLLISYSTPLVELASFCKNQDVKFPFLKAIISSSEQLHDFQKEIVEDAFGVKVYNRYGTREFGSIAQECSEHDGLHINSERVFIEILNDENKPCDIEEKGQLVITDLDNKVMPLIRYKVGDFAAWSGTDLCQCGRGLPKLAYIEGRSFDVIKTPNGTKISGTFWTLLTRHVSEDIKTFQIIQNKIESVDLNLVMLKNKTLSENQLSELHHGITKVDSKLQVRINFVEKIDLTKSGKQRFIVSRI